MSRCHTLLLAGFLGGCAARDARSTTALDAGASDPNPGAVLFFEGRAAAARGDSIRAEQYLSLAAERGYDRRAALSVLLQACVSSLHLRAALDHAEAYLLDHPDDARLRYLVATIHVGLGQRKEAREELERVLKEKDGMAEAHLLLGVLSVEINAGLAHREFVRYLELAPHGSRREEVQSRIAELEVSRSRRGQARQ